MKKVLYILNEFPCHSETFIIDQINGLIDREYDVSILTFKKNNDVKNEQLLKHDLINRTQHIELQTNYGLKRRKINQIINISSAIIKKPKSIFDLLSDILNKKTDFIKVAYLINQKNVYKSDIVIAHFGPTAVLANRLKNLNIITGKIYAVFHGYELSIFKELEKYKRDYSKLFKSDNIMLPISERWKKKLQTLGCKEEKIVVNRMGIDPERFRFITKKSENDTIKIITVARHSEKKGLNIAILAAEILKKKNINFNYEIIGIGQEFEKNKALIKELKLEENVTLTGYKPPSEIEKILENANLFILPSLTAKNGDQEGIPVALMEAMARGVLCISTNHSGIPELITHNQNGLLAKEGDPQDLAEKMEMAISFDQSKLEKLRYQARVTVEELYNQNINYNQLSVIFNND